MPVVFKAARVAVCGLVVWLAGCMDGTVPEVSYAAAPQVRPLLMHTQSPPSADLRVMSFNIRVRTFIDLRNNWSSRKGLLVHTIRQFDPDVLGTQECLAEQADFLRQQLPDYEFVGAGREDGYRGGEMCGVFYRTARFQQIGSGHFWLSETPSVPGSRDWGSAFPRMVTWVMLKPRDGGETFCVFNTHFDVFGATARYESAWLLRRQMEIIAPGVPCIITGDFNDTPHSAPYRTLLASHAGFPLVDAFRVARPISTRREGTRHGFKGGDDGPRIDWIITAGFQPLEAKIIHTHSEGGKFPSDHFPVAAVLRPMVTPLASHEPGAVGQAFGFNAVRPLTVSR